MSRVRWERVAGALVAVAAAGYVFLELRPELLFRNTTPNGGDTGAHVWWPAFMRDHVFPNLRLSGWAPDWYAGFPVGHFYFPIPALLIVGLDLVMPYNVAFKLVTALGPVLLPIAAYSFGRGIRAPWPAPPLMAVAMLPFLFFTGFTIFGGNLPSTLAGEFAFSIGFAMSLFFLGSLARALENGDRLWRPALLLGITVMTHIIAAVFAVVGAIVVWLFRRPVKRFPVALAIGGVAFLVSAIWAVPMVVRLEFATDMGWAKLTAFRENLLHEDMRWAVILAGVALVAGAASLRRSILETGALTLVFAVGFIVWPEGRLWNARLLPFYFVPLLLLAAAGVAEVVNLVRAALTSRLVARPPGRRWPDETGARPVPGSRAGSHESGVEPHAGARLSRAATLLGYGVVAVALVAAMVHARQTRDFIPGWIRWNYTGYEAKEAYPEYREIMDTLNGMPVPYGQRLLWERLDRINDYGSDLALELIPFFTDGKIGSMEGLYFESSATTPYHFMTVAQLASQPSNPVRGLPYGNIHDDFDRGVEHLQMMGVRFYMAGSEVAKEKAQTHPALEFVTEIGDPDREPYVARWAIYEVAESSVVQPLAFEPVVLDDVGPGSWLEPSVAWFNDRSQFARPLAGDGPAEWDRVVEADARAAPFNPLRRVEVSEIELETDRVRFRVSEPGVPVVVKVSYFPNWKASGADGPWRVTPNFMVVVPTAEHVELAYVRTPIDRAAVALSLMGLVGLVGLGRWRPGRLDDPPLRPEGVAGGGGVTS